jgi:hypothetical protein
LLSTIAASNHIIKWTILLFSTIAASNHIIIGIKTFLIGFVLYHGPWAGPWTCPRAVIEYKSL